MTSKLQRMIDLEVESSVHGDEFILPQDQQRELDELRKAIESILPKQFTEHRKEYNQYDRL